jgi:hypothetical protein
MLGFHLHVIFRTVAFLGANYSISYIFIEFKIRLQLATKPLYTLIVLLLLSQRLLEIQHSATSWNEFAQESYSSASIVVNHGGLLFPMLP